MCPLRNIGTAIVFLVAVDAASLCAWTSDDATKQWPSGWRDGLRSLHDLLRCEGYNKAARPLPGTIAELLQALEMEDDGTDAGIDRQRLKRKYRDLSVKHHPDKTRDSARFQKLRDAYEILEDPVKILLYDTGGMELLRKYEASSDALPVTESLELLHHVDLEDAYSGGSFKLAYTRQVVCLSCRLQPRLQRCRGCRPCPDIIEHQQVWVSPFEYYVKEIRLPSPERCRRRSESLDLPIERGVSFGQRLLFEMQADQRPQHVPGDLLVTLQMKRHRVFKKVGADLVVHLRISLLEALLGFDREIQHLDGHLVRIFVRRGTVVQPDEVLIIEGEGMPMHEDLSSYGRLLVRFTVDFPDHVPSTAAGPLESALKTLQ